MKRLAAAALATMLLIGAAACSPTAAEMDEDGSNEPVQISATDTPQTEAGKGWITVVVMFADYQDEEFAGVENAMAQSGYGMQVVSTSTGEAAGMNGRKLTINQTISEVDDYGLGVVVIGGTGSYVLWDDQDLITLIRRADADGSLVGAICAAPGALANAGALTDAQACWSNSKDLDAIMAGAGCEDTGQPVTRYENVITANGPAAAQAFGEAAAEYLDEE